MSTDTGHSCKTRGGRPSRVHCSTSLVQPESLQAVNLLCLKKSSNSLYSYTNQRFAYDTGRSGRAARTTKAPLLLLHTAHPSASGKTHARRLLLHLSTGPAPAALRAAAPKFSGLCVQQRHGNTLPTPPDSNPLLHRGPREPPHPRRRGGSRRAAHRSARACTQGLLSQVPPSPKK